MTDTTDIKALRERLIAIGDVEELHSFAIFLIDQLEAERQRADVAWEHWQAAQIVLGEQAEQIIILNREIAALKAKLANPVVLPAKEWDDGSDKQLCILNGKYNRAVNHCSEAISKAGFTVKGGE